MMARAFEDRRRRLASGWADLSHRISSTARGDLSDHDLVDLEVEVGGALHRVEPSDRFRESLRRNLTVAAERRAAGLIIEQPRSNGEALMLGILGGLLAALIAGVLMWAHARAMEDPQG